MVCSLLGVGQANTVSAASVSLAHAEAGTRKQLKDSKTSSVSSTRFPVGTEWELLHSDVVILHGITHALRFGSALFCSPHLEFITLINKC